MLILNIYHILNRSMEYQIKLVMFRLYQKVKIIYFSWISLLVVGPFLENTS